MGQNKLAWITGAGGLIGHWLARTASQCAPTWRVRPLTRADLDLLDFAAVTREFNKDRPQLVLHCAALTRVDAAQANPTLAWRINVEVTRHLAQLAAEISFVFFSTDLVFDGRQGHYRETDAPQPLHTYGETKAAAEEIVLKNPRHLVVRTSLNGGISPTGDRGFNERLRRELRAGRIQKLFTDEFRSPIPASETARAVWELVHRNCTGLFHVAGAEKLSRWQIGQLLVSRWPEISTPIESASAKDFSGPPRPGDTSLDISKAQNVLSRSLPGLSAWLAANPQEPF